MENVYKFEASTSELQRSKLFMQLKSVLFVADEPNANGVRVSEAFIDDIVEHKQDYVGIPLCVDTELLTRGFYKVLEHNLDKRTHEWNNEQIGTFQDFEKVTLADGRIALVGYARMPKRHLKIAMAISELFVNDALKLSFEITCGDIVELEDGTQLIDVSPLNRLEAMSIVSNPACHEAVVEKFVAEKIVDKEVDVAMDEHIETPATETPVDAAQEAAETPAEEQEQAAVCDPATEESKEEACDDQPPVDEKEEEQHEQAEENNEPVEAPAQDAAMHVDADIQSLIARLEQVEASVNKMVETTEKLAASLVTPETKIEAAIKESTVGEEENPFVGYKLGDKQYSLLQRREPNKQYSLL